MAEPSERGAIAAAGGGDRFDADTVRQILGRAAEEQHHLDSKLAETYSLEELEEIALETGISREAVRAAVEAHRAGPLFTTTNAARATHDGSRGWVAALERWMPRSWSPPLRHTVLAGIGIALFGALLQLPVVGPVLFWITLVVLITLMLLFMLGVSLF